MKVVNLNKKKWLWISLSAVLIIGIIVMLILIFGGNKEKELENSLKEMGIDFYENFYYDAVGTNDEERKTFLEKYTTIGIKINLDNLSRYNSEENSSKIKKFVNKKKECDKQNSMAIIYPKEPYKKGDYKIEIKLECEF